MVNLRLARNVTVLMVLALSAAGCATARKHAAVAPGEMSLKDICAQNDIFWQWDYVAQVATLEYKGARAEVLVGSDTALVGNEKISLSAPVRTVHSAVIVPPDFHDKVILRLIRGALYTDLPEIGKFSKIIIDAGHGGKDPGAIGFRGVQEKDIVLDISRRLEEILRDNGFEVTMTRDQDVFISLQERTEITSRANADLFVSVHANANTVHSVNGFEAYVAKDMGFQDKNEDQRKINHQLLFNELSMIRGSEDVEKIVADMLYTHKQFEARKLAGCLARHAVGATKANNLGVKSSRFFVVRNTLIPAVLVEVGFLTNPREARQLEDGAYRQQLAVALADGIKEFAGSR